MFNLSIIALDKKLYEGNSLSLTVPGIDGELTILTNHIPLITPLGKGKMKLKTEKEEISFQIKSGVLEIKPKKVMVLASV